MVRYRAAALDSGWTMLVFSLHDSDSVVDRRQTTCLASQAERLAIRAPALRTASLRQACFSFEQAAENPVRQRPANIDIIGIGHVRLVRGIPDDIGTPVAVDVADQRTVHAPTGGPAREQRREREQTVVAGDCNINVICASAAALICRVVDQVVLAIAVHIADGNAVDGL